MKMFTAERLSILLLAVALIIWALAVFLNKDSAEVSNPDTIPVPSASVILADSVEAAKNDSIPPAKPKKNTKKAKASKRSKSPVNHRDHLKEPIPRAKPNR